MAVKVIDEKEYARLIELTDGEKIKLQTDGELTVKVVSITHEKILGQFDFRLIDDGFNEYYKLTHMFLEDEPGYTGKGIGEACIRYCLDYSGLPIYCGQAVGEQADDGSHLTGNGEGFAMRMIEKKLISGQV